MSRSAHAEGSARRRAILATLVAVLLAALAIGGRISAGKAENAKRDARDLGSGDSGRRGKGYRVWGTTTVGSTDAPVTTTTPTTAAPRTAVPSTTVAAPPTTAANVPPPSPPLTPQPSSASVILWSTSMENGSLADWSSNGGGGIYNSGTFAASASTDIARTGSWSLKATIDTSGGSSGVRAFRWDEPRSNRAAYYSAWLYIPTTYTLSGSQQWWNVFQFKSRTTDGSRVDPVWGFYANQDAGGLYLRAGWGWGGTQLAGPGPSDGVSGKWYAPITKMYLPVGRWVHLEAYLNESKDFDGSLKFWQDGTLLFDLSGIRTSYSNCNFNSWCADNEWSVNLYSDGMSPNPSVVYFDDAAIGTGYIP